MSFSIKHFFLFLIIISLSCEKKNVSTEENPTEIKGYVEYLKKIKEDPDGNNYYAGYKQVELKKMLQRKNLLNQSRLNNDIEFEYGASASESATFTERGPQNASGRTRAIITDYSDNTGNTYYAASIGGGIWKGVYDVSTMTMSWSNLTRDIENLDFVSLAQSKSNPLVLYAGTGEKSLSGDDNGSGIFKTIDGGSTWNNIAPILSDGKMDPRFANVYRIIVDPNDENTLLIATERKYWCDSYVYKSTDGGNSWSEVLEIGDCGSATQIIAAPSDFNIQYVAVKGGNVFRSDDAGNTWTETSSFDVYEVDSWPFNSYHTRNEIVVSHSDPNKVYAIMFVRLTESHRYQINVTYDGGDNWYFVDENDKYGNPDYFNGGFGSTYIGRQGSYNNFIAINPYYDSILYVGDIDIHKFTIRNDTTKISEELTDVYNYISDGLHKKNGYVHPDQHTMSVFADGSGNYRLVVGNDGGPAISNLSPDPGINDNDWQATEFMWAWSPKRDSDPQIDIGYRTTQFYYAAKVKGKNQYIGGTQDNGTYLTREPNSSNPQYATRVGSGDGFGCITHWDDPLRMMLTCQYNGCAKITTDGGVNGPYSFHGTSGFKQEDNNPFVSKLATSKQDPNMIYGITYEGVIRTENFGDDWEFIKLKGSSSISDYMGGDIEVSEANPRFVWAGGYVNQTTNYSIFLSKDYGKTFAPVKIPKGVSAHTSGIYSHPNEDSTVYILFGQYGRAKVFETKDLGQTWKDLSGFLPNFQFSGDVDSSNGFPNVAPFSLVVMPFDSDIIWVGTEIGLIETTDRGESWNLVTSDLPFVMIHDLEPFDQGQVVIGTYGRGIWTAEIPGLMNWKPKETGVSLTLEKDTILENDDKSKINISLSREVSPYSPISIVFSLSGTASSSDYTLSHDTLNITNDEIPEFSITSVQDSDIEDDESLILSVSYIENGKIIGNEQLTLIIKDDDNVISLPSVTFNIDRSSINENADQAKIIATLNKEPNSGDVKVTFNFDGGTASSSDYNISSNPLVISSGNTAELTITSVQDLEDETDETIIVKVVSIENATGSINTVIGNIIILDDDEKILGIEDQNTKGIEIFPIPTEGVVSLLFDKSWEGNVNVKVFDVNGRYYFEKNLFNDSNNSRHEIDFSENNDGIYLLQIIQEDKILIKKIVKK